MASSPHDSRPIDYAKPIDRRRLRLLFQMQVGFVLFFVILACLILQGFGWVNLVDLALETYFKLLG